ncbi:flagellar basal body P-ring protein FlgI [Novosphingobium sp. NBM11]|jgi:flagellar P-ring protein precursor FlgI|uniref:flagellar basal body P-ring protein FlgI n=1 Tax=unclassified Novosphingobium TaxID=2644732 RepID=UPI00086E762B|nr:MULTISPECIES: flagellar basal body P-ring protein FlgI [unclassified Novosphingobium]MBF5091488.1 flagellar basal body P-ring protein FlgI [Novosphingobium sp. NBM11]ODU70205.1 MAG: flagellar biosynthesis protein FlgI [Novosphingobium sp. SCN 66-18]
MRRLLLPLTAAFAAALAAVAPVAAHAERVRDLGAFQGVRTNQLTGYGIVVGLAGTGDDNLEYLTQAMKGTAGRLGVQLPPGVSPGLKNAAAVLITADLPAFAKPGQRIDVTVSTLGKAKSLRGGALIMTPLYGADGQIYAMAQGNLAVGGLGVAAKDGSQVTVNIPTVGRIAEGASVERAVATGFDDNPILRWNLFNADFLTASRVRDAINARYPGMASVEDGVTLALHLPEGADARASTMAAVEMIEVNPAETPARVIVNSRTGTVVINSAVRLAPAAISHGKLVVKIDEKPQVSQPAPFSNGRTTVTPNSQIDVQEQQAHVALFKPGASLSSIVDALNKLGVTPSDLVAILEALKQAGSLKAEMVVI